DPLTLSMLSLLSRRSPGSACSVWPSGVVSATGPFACGKPDFVVKQPVGSPGEDRRGDHNVVLPFTGKVEAECASRIDVGQVSRVEKECKSRLHDVDVERLPVSVLYSRTVGFAADWVGPARRSRVDRG